MSKTNMTPEQFCYWLNGHFDLSALDALTTDQVRVIREHLEMVFDKKVEGINLMEDSVKKTSPLFPNLYPTVPNYNPFDFNTKPVC